MSLRRRDAVEGGARASQVFSGSALRPRDWVLMGLGLALALPSVFKPADVGWEWLTWSAAESVAREGTPRLPFLVGGTDILVVHPPAWTYVLGASIKAFGTRDWAVRLPGLGAFAATAWLGAGLARRLGGGPAAATIFLALFLTNPAAIQGSLFMDFADGTLLTFSILLFMRMGLLLERRGSWWKMGLVFSLCLWAKVTTSLGLVAAGLLTGRLRRTAQWAICGAAVFAASWALYCAWLSGRVGEPFLVLFLAPFGYVRVSAGYNPPLSLPLPYYGLMALRVLLYYGLILVPLGFWEGLRSWRKDADSRPAWLFAALVFAVYIALQATTGGFSRYQLPALPILCLGAALWFERFVRPAPGPRFWLAGLAIGVPIYAFIVGDYLRVLNHDLRLGLLAGNTAGAWSDLARRLAFYGAFAAAAAWTSRRLGAGPAAGLLGTVLSSQLAMDGWHAFGGYHTRYGYGSSETATERVRDKLAGLRPPRRVLAPEELAYRGAFPVVPGGSRSFWREPTALRAVVIRERPQAVVYGLPTHTVDQVRSIRKDAALQALLKRDYREETVGEYTVWLRRR